MRALVALLLIVIVAVGAIFFISRRETAPLVTIEQPGRVVGQNGTLAVSAETPGRKFTQFDVTLEQNGQVLSKDMIIEIRSGEEREISIDFDNDKVASAR